MSEKRELSAAAAMWLGGAVTWCVSVGFDLLAGISPAQAIVKGAFLGFAIGLIIRSAARRNCRD